MCAEHLSGKSASNQLFRFLIKTGLFSSLLILIVAAFGVSYLYNQHLIEESAHDAVSAGQAILALEKHQLVVSDHKASEQLHVTPEGFDQLDRVMQSALAPFNITKIKIFTRDGTVAYSTDHSIIGRNNKSNPDLQVALSGGIIANYKTRDALTDLRGETKFDVDVVSSYIPISNSQGQVIGSFEVYQDVTDSNEKSIQAMVHSVIFILMVLAVVYGISFVVVKRAADELDGTHQQLFELATLDSLTGVKNRAAIIAAVKAEFSRSKRAEAQGSDQPVSLIMIDVDNFKSINDRFGHHCGDDALQAIVQEINSAVREHDWIGRYGGEEFLLLLPHTSAEGAKALAERIRLNVVDMVFEVDGNKIDFSVSAGLTTIDRFDKDYEEALKDADRALYEAKNAGRNRVVVFRPSTDSSAPQ